LLGSLPATPSQRFETEVLGVGLEGDFERIWRAAAPNGRRMESFSKLMLGNVRRKREKPPLSLDQLSNFTKYFININRSLRVNTNFY
jgi:hypothetical protein